jgi:hypothetical protein
MNRTIARGGRRTPGLRRPPANPVVERLEDRLALSAAPVPVPVPPPAAAGPVVVQAGPVPPPPAVPNPLLAFGGGKTQMVLLFPPAGGSGSTAAEAKGAVAETSTDEPSQDAAFDGALVLPGASLVHADGVDSALTEAAEAVTLE